MAPIGAILYEWRMKSLHDNLSLQVYHGLVWFYWGLTPQQQPGSYQGGEMMMKSVFWWRKPEYPEETTDRVSWSDCHGVRKFNWLGNQHLPNLPIITHAMCIFWEAHLELLLLVVA